MKILTVLSFIFSSFLYCQNIQLIDTSDYVLRTQAVKDLEALYKRVNDEVKHSYKGKMKKEMEVIYESSQNYFIESITNKKYLFNTVFNNYIDSISQQISNQYEPMKNKNLTFFIGKDPVPNAFCLGDNTYIINLGLFSILDNEHQLVSVISHEVAHQVLKHGEKNIERKANAQINVLDKRSSTVKSIRKQDYNRGSASFEILKNLLYEQGEIKRKQETEADSLGYLIFKKLDANASEYVFSLNKLVMMDSVPTLEVGKSIYKTIFDLPEQPFDENWFKSESFENYNYDFYTEKITKDSINSHPEAIERIANLRKAFPELKDISEPMDPNSKFLKLKELAIKSKVENLYYLNEYGLSVYLILYRLEHEIDVDYCKAWLSINFQALYEAKKQYQLNRYLDRIVPKEQSESYQQFLNFMWNLKLNELKSIADYYNNE